MGTDSKKKMRKGKPAGPWNMQTLVGSVKKKESGQREGILTVASGLDTGKVFPIPAGEMLVLGRADSCKIRFDDESLSREHARLINLMGQYVLSDDNSTNGTFVNEERLSRPRPLNEGDRVRLGLDTVLRFSLVTKEERQALSRVYEAAVIDPLMGIANRKNLEERLEGELAFVRRHGAPLSVLLVDLDHFKNVNDTYGHLAGDKVLAHTAGVLKSLLRREDVIGRYGGEEILIIVRNDTREAAVLGERLRSAVASTAVTFDGIDIPVTMSVGVASASDCGDAIARDSLLAIVDRRLYLAKERGRNRVVSSDS